MNMVFVRGKTIVNTGHN